MRELEPEEENFYQTGADKAAQSVPIRWGWALLIAVALLLMASAALKAGFESRSDQAK